MEINGLEVNEIADDRQAAREEVGGKRNDLQKQCRLSLETKREQACELPFKSS